MRISTLAQSLASQNSILDLQQKISIVREQITTGKQSSSYGGLKGEDARFSVRLRETVETIAFDEGMSHDVEQLFERLHIALIGGGQRFLDQMIPRDVHRVHSIHRIRHQGQVDPLHI